MRTYHHRTVRRAVAVLAASAALLGTGAGYAATAKADAPAGTVCVTDSGFWFLKGTRRTLCDTGIRADGSWTRYREFWTPSYYRNASSSCYGGAYYSNCTFTPGGVVPLKSNGVEEYVVFPTNVLPDEPGHIA